MNSDILHGTLLVVDDDPKVILFINGVFTPRGYQVITASSADEGLKIVEKLSDDIDLILLDLRMPGQIDGIEALKRIKNKYPDMPVGILTAYEGKEKECLANGADFFITKPYSLKDLYERIEKIVKTKERPEEIEVQIKDGYVPAAKILIVDDEEAICEHLKESLEEGIEAALGEYKVEIALDGKKGIEKNREFAPDIIIVDIKMPHLRGDEMISIIEKEGPKPKDYIILTAVDGDDDKRMIRKSGYPYISKPFDEIKFCEKLRKLCFKHELIKPL